MAAAAPWFFFQAVVGTVLQLSGVLEILAAFLASPGVFPEVAMVQLMPGLAMGPVGLAWKLVGLMMR